LILSFCILSFKEGDKEGSYDSLEVFLEWVADEVAVAEM
jgi:hypothetical protein